MSYLLFVLPFSVRVSLRVPLHLRDYDGDMDESTTFQTPADVLRIKYPIAQVIASPYFDDDVKFCSFESFFLLPKTNDSEFNAHFEAYLSHVLPQSLISWRISDHLNEEKTSEGSNINNISLFLLAWDEDEEVEAECGSSS